MYEICHYQPSLFFQLTNESQNCNEAKITNEWDLGFELGLASG